MELAVLFMAKLPLVQLKFFACVCCVSIVLGQSVISDCTASKLYCTGTNRAYFIHALLMVRNLYLVHDKLILILTQY